MESYIVRTKIDIERQAGDSGRIVFTVPAEVSLTGYDVLFQVRDDSDEILFDYIDFLKENNLLNKNTLKDLNNVYTDKKIFKKLLKKQLTSDPTEFKEKYVEFLDK